jgi:signal recognition particle subunit SRP54
MFQEITDKFETVFKRLRGQGKLTEKNIADSMRQVRRVLLEADVNYRVAKDFIKHVEEKAVGHQVLRSITPGQQVIKIIHDELVRLMGEKHAPIKFSNQVPSLILLCGLQGSGKTTFAGKLANHFRKKGHKPLLIAADIYRPAAIEQLKVVGKQLDVPVWEQEGRDVVKIVHGAIDYARQHMIDMAIIDTAGRLALDEQMMDELKILKKTFNPSETLFVADGMTGQDAVNTSKTFSEHLDFDGVVLTKMDGDARGGAALSIRSVTQKPIKFLSVGEKLDQIEPFHPDRIASRILGMGDVVSLVEKAQENIDEKKALELQRKLREKEFSLEDFMDQLQQIKKMGPLQDVLGMLPGANKMLKGVQVDDRSLVLAEAIINSMTLQERQRPQILNGSRRKRIARGSGTSVQDVNRLINQYNMLNKMMKQMQRGGSRQKLKMPFGF